VYRIFRLLPAIAICLACIASFSSCNKTGSSHEQPGNGLKKKWNFTIVKFEELQQTEDTERGLRVGLRDAGLVEGRDFDMHSMNAHGDIPTLLTLFDKAASDNTDLLISLQTTTLHTAVKRVQKIPIVFMVVANPFVITTVGQSDSVHLPNVTGVYTMTTFDRMLGYIKECMPNVKKVGTLFSSLELNATYYKSQLITAGHKYGITVETMDVSTKTDVPQAMHALCTRNLDAICQIEDNLTSATFPFIAQVAQKFKLPVFSFVNEQAHTGSSLVFAPNYFESAREAATTISRIMHGTSAELIPFKRINKFNLIVNTTFSTAAGLTIPESVRAAADSVITTAH
jgi:ABC-type uncharacterized transport system substrate-binding protein